MSNELRSETAKVVSAGLRIKERGMLTFQIQVTYQNGSTSQRIGGIVLDTPKGAGSSKFRRVGTAFGCEMIIRLLRLFDVDNLHEAAGQVIEVLGTGSVEEFNFKPKGLRRTFCDRKDSHEIVYERLASEMVSVDQ